jgi:hypothetical protein
MTQEFFTKAQQRYIHCRLKKLRLLGKDIACCNGPENILIALVAQLGRAKSDNDLQ